MATTEFALTRSTWTDLGTTPCALQCVSNFALTFVVDTAAPASAATRGHILTNPGEASANVALTGQRVFARALVADSASVVVTR